MPPAHLPCNCKPWDSFIGGNGKPRAELFVDDKLHNNEAGYKIRVQLVKPFLDDK
ncbi:MAG: hypothetical protein WCN98_05405 [Verrucomicrobiaceae bacterium]